jgi:DNA-binding NarL/FixJ family response regulator
VKVVLISGFLEPEIRTKLLEAGAEGFIQKPFKPNEILGLIRQVIDIAKG